MIKPDLKRKRTVVLLLFLIVLTSWYCSGTVSAEEGDSGIPGDYTQYVSMSEATPYPEPEIIEIPIEDGVYFSDTAIIPTPAPAPLEPVLSEEELEKLERERLEAENTIVITNSDEFNDFAAFCSDRMWSVGKKVYLECDIDLQNENFTPIAYFSGEFYGNRHTISGLNIKGSYARAGFFATLTDTAFVTELRIAGIVKGTGKSISGGIVGENYGTLRNVLFQGSVISEYAAGGIAGLNLDNAVISDSKAGGVVEAPSCAGGICADNRGLISACENHCEILTGTQGFRKLIENRDCHGAVAGVSSGNLESCRDITGAKTSTFIQIKSSTLLLNLLIGLGIMFFSGAVALILVLLFDRKKVDRNQM